MFIIYPPVPDVSDSGCSKLFAIITDSGWDDGFFNFFILFISRSGFIMTGYMCV